MAGSRPVEEQAVVMTRDGYEKLKAELAHLRSEGRAEIARMLEEARAFGDLSENAEYHAAKEAQEKLESRIVWLESQLSRTKVIDARDVDASRVTVGTTVTLRDVDTQTDFTYTIVGSDEADPRANRISAASPVGKAVLNHEIGDEVLVRVPKGFRKLKIVEIQVL